MHEGLIFSAMRSHAELLAQVLVLCVVLRDVSAAAPVPCPVGEFSTTGSVPCTSCGTGNTTLSPGATSEAQCQPVQSASAIGGAKRGIAWGADGAAFLGIPVATEGEFADAILPVTQLDALFPAKVRRIVGSLFSKSGFALLDDGAIASWGDNSAGRLGLGDGQSRNTPTKVTSATGVKQIAIGGIHTLALHFDGTVSAAGGNTRGQLGLKAAQLPQNLPITKSFIKISHFSVYTPKI